MLVSAGASRPPTLTAPQRRPLQAADEAEDTSKVEEELGVVAKVTEFVETVAPDPPTLAHTRP